MSRSIRYHPLFDSDVLNAADWYDRRNSELGAEFGIRYWPVERFPYVVFYDLTELEVLVIGVMHTSQDSQKWLAGRG